MRLLEDMDPRYRIVITFVIILALLFILALIGYLTGGWDDSASALASHEP